MEKVFKHSSNIPALNFDSIPDHLAIVAHGALEYMAEFNRDGLSVIFWDGNQKHFRRMRITYEQIQAARIWNILPEEEEE